MDLTVVAFLNTDGGVLLVGGGDDADILGIEVDQFEEDFYIRVGPGTEAAGFLPVKFLPI